MRTFTSDHLNALVNKLTWGNWHSPYDYLFTVEFVIYSYMFLKEGTEMNY